MQIKMKKKKSRIQFQNRSNLNIHLFVMQNINLDFTVVVLGTVCVCSSDLKVTSVVHRVLTWICTWNSKQQGRNGVWPSQMDFDWSAGSGVPVQLCHHHCLHQTKGDNLSFITLFALLTVSGGMYYILSLYLSVLYNFCSIAKKQQYLVSLK